MQGTPVFTAGSPQPTPASAGCWYDCSALSDFDLDTVIIRLALEFGARFDLGTDEQNFRAYSVRPHEITADEAQFMHEVSEEALTWLTCNVAPEDHVFVIQDNSLFLEAYGQED